MLYDNDFGTPSMDKMEHARKLCADLISTGDLSTTETELALKVYGVITENMDTLFSSFDKDISTDRGGPVNYAKAIGRVIASRHPDILFTQEYNFEDEQEETAVSVMFYDRSNSDANSEYPDVSIIMEDFKEDTIFVFNKREGASSIIEDGEEIEPEKYHVTTMMRAIKTALDVKKNNNSRESDVVRQQSLQDLVNDIRTLDQNRKLIDPDNHEALRYHQDMLDALMEELNRQFQSIYHLVNMHEKVDQFSPQLEKGPLKTYRNVLFMRTPIVYVADPYQPSGYSPVYPGPDKSVVIHYHCLSFEDPTGGLSDKDVHVIGTSSPESGKLSIVAIPLLASKDPVYAFARNYN